MIYNNTDKSQLYSTPHKSEPTVLALAGLSKRQRINSQLKITLVQYIQLLRRFRYSVSNSSTKHNCSNLSLPRFPLQFNREKINFEGANTELGRGQINPSRNLLLFCLLKKESL